MAAETNADITYQPTPGLTPDQTRDARARAWRFVFECWEQKKAAGPAAVSSLRMEKGGVEHDLTWTFCSAEGVKTRNMKTANDKKGQHVFVDS